MARQRLDGYDSPFSEWVRSNGRLPSSIIGVTDNDAVMTFHKHHVDRRGTRDVQHIMLVEVKTHDAVPTESQRDTLKILSQLLCKQVKRKRKDQSKRPARECRTVEVYSSFHKKMVTAKGWGVHLLQFSGTSPVDSDRIRWNGVDINTYTLERLLRGELNPWTLNPLRDRRHKKRLDS